MFKKTIFTGFSPNLTKQDVYKALGFLLLPWKWKKWRKGKADLKVINWIQDYFGTKYNFTFDSGRLALHFALKSLGIGEGDEVLVQAYTCVVVSNAIIWTGATPVYIDIGDDLNMDPENLEKNITQKSKVIIIQHTFGQPAELEKLLDIAKKNNLRVIEDCAHSLGGKYSGKLTGTFGDIGMFSFGSDKVVSCVRGGALITGEESIANKLEEFHKRLPQTDRLLIFQHLMHYPVFFIGKVIYHLKIGKLLLAVAKKINLINKIIYGPEKQGKQVQFYPSRLPNALAEILLRQLKNLDKVNQHRRMIADVYNKKLNKEIKRQKTDTDSTYLRYTIFVGNSDKLRASAKKQGIILGDWYNPVIAPKDIDISSTGYKQGSCPNAEKFASMSVNLPTNRHITKQDANFIAEFINKFYAS